MLIQQLIQESKKEQKRRELLRLHSYISTKLRWGNIQIVAPICILIAAVVLAHHAGPSALA